MGARFLVLYASQTGNARGLAKEVGARGTEKGHDVRVLGMEHFKELNFENEAIIVVIASSTGNGDCPDNGDKFLRHCKKKTTPQFLANSRFAVAALGDSNYEAFCAVGKEFDKQFERLGGQRFLKRLDIDEVEGIETFFEPWLERLWESLAPRETSLAPTADGLADSTQAPPNLSAPPVEASYRGLSTADGIADCTQAPPNLSVPPTGASRRGLAPTADGLADSDAVGRSAARPLMAPVVAARWLTSAEGARRGWELLKVFTPRHEHGTESARRVLHVELDVSEGGDAMAFEPGDALGVVPHNDPEVVDATLACLGITKPDAPLPPLAEMPAHLQGVASVREALTWRLDLGSVSVWPPLPLLRLLLASRPAGATVPAKEPVLLALVAQATANATAGTASRTAAQKAHAALQRQRPSLVELVTGLAPCAPSLAALVDTLPPLAPRWYSIASAPAAEPGRMHLCLSIVEYVALAADGSRRQRRGLATSMIARVCAPLLGDGPSAATGARDGARPRLAVFRRDPSGHELRLPKAPSTPLILIGPGTGVAPFRAFLMQRRHRWKPKQLGPCHLFFGCRAPGVDFLYEEELRAMAATGALTLHTAFSRQGEPSAAGTWRGVRVNVSYVQDRIEEAAAEVCELLFSKGGHVYVCGDGQSMASDVHAALRLAVSQQLRLSREEAEAKLTALSREGRYCREIWN